jgi:hypothetical protein
VIADLNIDRHNGVFGSFIFRVGILTVLIAYLCVSVGLRLRAGHASRRSRGTPPPGTAFDVSAIAPQLRRVRQDHVAALHSRPRHPSHRAVLVAVAQRIVTNLPFFRDARSEHDVQNHVG